MLACPSADPWTGGLRPPECVSEYSGPGGFGFGAADRNSAQKAATATHVPAGFAGPARVPYDVYSFSTLTPGSWLLYPGYQTVFGSYLDPSGTSVAIVARTKTTQTLTVPYQVPTVGAVVGNVTVIGAPTSGFQSGVQACTTPPTATTCVGEQEAYNYSSGAYTLLLGPGWWWVRGFVDVYSGVGVSESTGPSRVVGISVGVADKASFTVRVS